MSPRARRHRSALVAVVAMGSLLAACGGGDESTPAVTGEDVGQTTQPAEPTETTGAEGEVVPPDESAGEEDTNQEGGFGEKDDVGQD